MNVFVSAGTEVVQGIETMHFGWFLEAAFGP